MDKNTKILTAVLCIVIAMGALAYASVPLYNLFCRVTGYGGMTKVADTVPDKILDRKVTVKFNADVSRNFPWTFKPDEHQTVVNIGQAKLIAYHAKNRSTAPVAGTAIYNVSPPKAGKYFHKTQCFCFDRQVLKPGEDMQMPVVFFIDPKMAEDRDMDDVSVITLSYTFFPADSKELDDALEAFYNADETANKAGEGPAISN